MANTAGFPTYNAFRTSMMGSMYPTSGVKAALYLVSATTGPTNTAYTVTGEVSGAGYSAGGVTVTTAQVPQISGSVTYWTPSASISFGTVTVGPTDCVMIYDTGASGRNIYIGTFGSQTVTAAPFTLTMPTDNSTTALVRITWS